MLHLGVSLRTRLTLWYGALMALTLLAFSALLYFTLQRSLYSSVDEQLNVRAENLRREVAPSISNLLQPEDVAPGQLESTLADFVDAPGIYVQVLNPRAKVVAAAPNLAGGGLPVPDSSRTAIQQDQPIRDEVPVLGGDATVRLLTVPLHNDLGEVVGAVQVGESLAPVDATMAAIERLMLVSGGSALVIALCVGWLLTHSALSPVARITATARHIAETGDYRQRLHVTPPRLGHGDELFFLAATFNDMIARLEQLLDSQQRLLADTSHELRNPITIIRGNLALLRRERVPESSRREAILEAEEEAARMGRLVSDLLLLARADAGELPAMARAPVDLSAVAAEVLEQARPSASAASLQLDLHAGQPCWVLGDRDRLKQLVANLVENAVRYTPAAGHVTVSVLSGAGAGARRAGLQQASGSARSRTAPPGTGGSHSMATLVVSDSGIGISPTDLPHVFERFYRADKARTRAHGGSGLGLSIAEYIVHAHAGRIEVSSDGPNRGTTVRVQLPLLSEADALERMAPELQVAPAAR